MTEIPFLNQGTYKMWPKILWNGIAVLCLIIFCNGYADSAGKPDVTRHEAKFLENAVNLHIEWQSANPVAQIKVSMPNIEREFSVDSYDNKRNPEGYSGEMNVTLNLGFVPVQAFSYVIQLQDELRLKSQPVTGQVSPSSLLQSGQLNQNTLTYPSTQIYPSGQSVQYGPYNQSIPNYQPVQSGQSGQPSQPQPSVMQIQIQQNVTQPPAQTNKQQAGAVTVIISPFSVADAGAMWRVDGGAWKKSGETMTDMVAGVHSIDFLDVSGWKKPEPQKIMIETGQNVSTAATYQK